MADSDEEDYHFFGTPIEDDHEGRAGTYRKEPGKDAATTRQLPVWKQEVTDAQGRRRFHGAFTGGFSAGYYNTVGSAEGWAPSSFRSSRSDTRGAAGAAQAPQSVEQFLDEDELEELRQTNLQNTSAYDTFGSTAAEAARRAAEEEARQRPSAIPGLLPEEAIAPVAEGIGIQLLQRMGWRQGKGVGAAGIARQEGNSRRGWGHIAGIGPENTPLHLIQPKHDVHGIGYDPFKGAEEFRAAAAAAAQHGLPTHTNTLTAAATTIADQRNKRRRGVAFGTGVLDEDDTLGMMEDYVTHDDVESYQEIAGLDSEGLPQRRGPIVHHQGLGDRLALQGFAYEVQDEVHSDDDDEDIPGGSSLKKQKIFQLTGSAAPLLLKNATELHEQRQQGLILGFVLAINGGLHKPTYYPPPNIPADYIPVHKPMKKVLEKTSGAPAAVVVPVPAPENEILRQDIERLAFFVARNGPSFEALAREQQQRALTSGIATNSATATPTWSFLLGGQGAAYYSYKLASLRALLAPRGKHSKPLFAPIEQRSVPLTAEDRGAMLGEQPLPAFASTATGGGVGGQGGAVAAVAANATGARAPPPVPLARSILNLAEEDRKRLAAAMGSTFVRGETEGERHLTEQGASGLRPGVVPATAATAKAISSTSIAPVPQKPRGIVTREDLSQPTGASFSAAQIQKEQGQQAQQQPPPPELPIRKTEEWRPEPLLCKRLDVPDPYRGKPKELHMSRFKTDHLVLPATAEALGRAAAAAAPSGPEFLLPPAVRVAAEEAAAAAQLATVRATGRLPLPPPAFPPPQQERQQGAPEAEDTAGAGEAAEAFLSSLFGQAPDAEGHGEAEEDILREVAALEKPVDLFKAIFEDSEEDEEEEDKKDDGEDVIEDKKYYAVEEKEPSSLPQQPHNGMLGSGRIQDKDTAFGFEKFRGAGKDGNINLATAGAAGETSFERDLKDSSNPSGLESLDPGVKSRIEAALKVLQESKKKHKERKKNKKRKKERKDRDRSSKRKGREKERKKRKKELKEKSNDNSDPTSSSSSDSE